MTGIEVGFTGSRGAPSELQREWLGMVFAGLNIGRLHHGDCVDADALAHELCSGLSIPVLIHPPTVDRYRAFCDGPAVPPKSYHARNRDIVDACQLLVALPNVPECTRSGTWSTVRYARSIGRDVLVLRTIERAA